MASWIALLGSAVTPAGPAVRRGTGGTPLGAEGQAGHGAALWCWSCQLRVLSEVTRGSRQPSKVNVEVRPQKLFTLRRSLAGSARAVSVVPGWPGAGRGQGSLRERPETRCARGRARGRDKQMGVSGRPPAVPQLGFLPGPVARAPHTCME